MSTAIFAAAIVSIVLCAYFISRDDGGPEL